MNSAHVHVLTLPRFDCSARQAFLGSAFFALVTEVLALLLASYPLIALSLDPVLDERLTKRSFAFAFHGLYLCPLVRPKPKVKKVLICWGAQPSPPLPFKASCRCSLES